MAEAFRSIEGYEGFYSVSDIGTVRNDVTGRILKPAFDKYGYLYHVLCVNGNRKTVKVHRLVAKAFIPNPDGKKTVDHINAVKTDNRAENLRWATNKEQANNPHNIEAHLNSICPEIFRYYGKLHNYNRKRVSVLKDNQLVGEFDSLKEAANAVGANYTKASEVAHGKRNMSNGYVFRYIEDGGEK